MALDAAPEVVCADLKGATRPREDALMGSGLSALEHRDILSPMPAPDSETLCSAALRHLRDAEALALPQRAFTPNEGPPSDDSTSPDQVWHLAGLALECSEKSALQDTKLNKAIGHTAEHGSRELLHFALAIDPRAARLGVSLEHPPELQDWTLDCRYEATGSRSEEEAKRALSAARQHVLGLSCALWVAGLLSGGAL